MSEQRGTVCFVIEEDDQLYLCVIDDEKGAFHRFPLTTLQASRLGAECSNEVNLRLIRNDPRLKSV